MTAVTTCDRVFYTRQEFASLLGVHRETVSAMVARGELRAVRVGRDLRIPASERERLAGGPLISLGDEIQNRRQTVLLVRTAKGGTPSAQPLLPEAAEALERLQASGRLARYDSAVGGLALRRACTAAGVAPLRVYDLRHSFGTAVLQATDQRTAQAALRHASIQTTHRYTLSAVPERVAVALRLIGGRDTAAGKTPGRRRA